MVVASWFSDKLGRKFAFFLGAVMNDISISLMMWSPNLILFRVLEGLHYPYNWSHFQARQSDIFSWDIRFISWKCPVVENVDSCGNVSGHTATYLFPHRIGNKIRNNVQQWELGLASRQPPHLPVNLLLLVLPFVPDTPRWYFSVRGEEKALEVLRPGRVTTMAS